MISRDYGKISGWWSKKNISGIDIWDVVEVVLSRDGNKNTIKNIDIQIPSWSREWSYIRIIAFLESIKIISNITREWVECRSLYDDTLLYISYGRDGIMDIGQDTVFQMRILKSLGSMDREALGWDPVLGYIYDHITETPLRRIFGQMKIKKEHIDIIKQVNLCSLSTIG